MKTKNMEVSVTFSAALTFIFTAALAAGVCYCPSLYIRAGEGLYFSIVGTEFTIFIFI